MVAIWDVFEREGNMFEHAFASAANGRQQFVINKHLVFFGAPPIIDESQLTVCVVTVKGKVDIEFLRGAYRLRSTLRCDEMWYGWTVDFIYIRSEMIVESLCPFPWKLAILIT